MKLGSRNARVVAVAIAAVLVFALGGSLLMQVTKTPPIELPTASASASPTASPTPGFSATGSMTTGGDGATATLLADGRVLFAGGAGSTTLQGPAINSAELYDPKTGAFSPTGSMTAARWGHTATLLPDGRVLIVGGAAGRDFAIDGPLPLAVASAELYDPKTGKFTKTGAMSTAREFHTATLLSDGRVLIAGGMYSDGKPHGISPLLVTAEIYDPKTGTFSPTGSMIEPRAQQTATLLSDGRVLIACGEDANGTPITSAELFDPKTGSFSPTGSASAARNTANLLPDGRVLMVGITGGVTSSAELYEPASGTFSQAGSMVTPRYTQTATLLADGRVLVTGESSAELYDPASGTFSRAGTMTIASSGYTATLLRDGRVLMAGGAVDQYGKPVTSAELYQPPSIPSPSGIPSPAPTASASSAAPRFSMTGSMIVARNWGTTATPLSDGRVLIAGGVDSSGHGLTAAELYNPATGTFSRTGSMTTPRGGHTATLLPDGRVLIVGGANEPTYGGPPPPALASAELYDPKTGIFSRTGSTATPREWHTATLLPDGRVLIAGGTGNHGTFAASAELYNPATGKFSRTGSMATGRAFDTATLLSDGTVLFAGGEGAANDTYATLRSAELYAPATGKFSPTGSMAAARDYGSATLLADGRVLMAGGSEDASAELYDPTTRTFSATGSMKAVRLGPPATVLLDGRVLITGGSGDASAELYDPTNGIFSPTNGSMNAVRFSHTATRLPDGSVLIAGGNPLGLAMLMPSFASAELYQP
jgi:uncharacterized delta-60 repeat protein